MIERVSSLEQMDSLEQSAAFAAEILNKSGWSQSRFKPDEDVAFAHGSTEHPLELLFLSAVREHKSRDLLRFKVTTGYTNDGRAFGSCASFDVKLDQAELHFEGSAYPSGAGYDEKLSDEDNLLNVMRVAHQYLCQAEA